MKNAFILQVNTDIGTKTLTLCALGYDMDDTKRFTVPRDIYVDIIVDFGDLSPRERYTGVYGINQTITHTYTNNGLVNVSIIGLLPSWNCADMYDYGRVRNFMTVDVLQWGRTQLKQVNFNAEQYLAKLTAKQPPLSVTDYAWFFPYKSTNNALWDNLHEWDFSTMEIGNGFFYATQKGVLNLTGASFPRLKYAYKMFELISVPIMGNLTDMRAPALEMAERMFSHYRGGPIDLSKLETGLVKNFKHMFALYKANAIDVSAWNTSSATTLEEMFLLSSTDWESLDITYWDVRNVENMSYFLFGCNNSAPIFNLWNMRKVRQCDFVINSSTYYGLQNKVGLHPNTNYNDILKAFNENTNNSLVFHWGPPITHLQKIDAKATTSEGLLARQALLQRGCIISDLT
jgi:surface protein